MYTKDYKKIICSDIKKNCDKIIKEFKENNQFISQNSDKFYKKESDDTIELINNKSTNYIDFDSHYNVFKKIENKDSDSSSSNDDEGKRK